MNLIGKLLVVVIFLLTGLFVVLAMGVYSTQKNWRDAYQASQKTLQQKNVDYEQLDSASKLMESNLKRDLAAANQRLTLVETERAALVTSNENLQAEVNGLKQDSRDATTAVASTQDNAERLTSENVVLQKDIIAAQQAADQSFTATVAATSRLHDSEVKLASATETLGDLTEQVAGMSAVMRNEGLDPATRVGDSKPRVDGYISSVRRQAGSETIELTIGSDDGIKRGHTVEVYRTTDQLGQSKWLGRAVVLSTDGDRSYARILPELKKGRIQEGDRVATRFN